MYIQNCFSAKTANNGEFVKETHFFGEMFIKSTENMQH